MTQNINLINPALRARREPISAGSLVPAIVGVCALLIAGHVFVKQRADATQAELAQVEAQLRQEQDQMVAAGRAAAAVKPSPQLAIEVEAGRAALQARQNVMSALGSGALGDTGGFSEQFRAFSRQTMAGLWLTGFSLSAGGSEISIQGRALSADLVPAYIRRLNGERVFRGRPFASLLIEEAKAPAAQAAASTPAAAPPRQEVTFHLTSSAGGQERRR